MDKLPESVESALKDFVISLTMKREEQRQALDVLRKDLLGELRAAIPDALNEVETALITTQKWLRETRAALDEVHNGRGYLDDSPWPGGLLPNGKRCSHVHRWVIDRGHPSETCLACQATANEQEWKKALASERERALEEAAAMADLCVETHKACAGPGHAIRALKSARQER